MRSWAEHKVVEYVLRHTWGFREYAGLKRISLDEFENGRRRSDGSRIDHGIGMRRQAIISGIRQAVKDGYLIEEVDASDRRRTKKYYGLHMLAAGGCDNYTSIRERHQEKKPFADLMKKIEDIDQPQARADYVAEYILAQLSDEHSEAFYRLLATKIPEAVIRTAIAEVKADGARAGQALHLQDEELRPQQAEDVSASRASRTLTATIRTGRESQNRNDRPCLWICL